MQYLLKKKLVDRIYHSVEIWDSNNERFPAYRDGDEYVYIGVDDTRFMNAYIREIASYTTDKVVDLGGCGKKMYTGKVGYRLVLFNDFENRNHDDLLVQMLTFVFRSHIELTRVITNNEELLKQEANPKNFTFGATTFYKAIDFTVSIRLESDKCHESIGCGNWPNPITEIIN